VSRRVAPIAIDVLSAVRTPVGRRRGALSHVRVDDLAALVIREAVMRSGVGNGDVDEVFAGCVNASGEAMGNLARVAARLAGLPAAVPGVTLNRWCGSGLSALAAGAQQIAAGAADVVVAVGAESMSRSTWPVPMPDRPFAGGRLVARDAMFSGAGGPQHPALEASGDMVEMPDTAQELVRRYGLSREALDAWTLRSHQRAAEAQDDGAFDAELVAVPAADGGMVVADETVRRTATAERLATLTPLAQSCPDITAGNSSPVNDGASALVLAAPSVAERLGRRPLARLVGVASAGVDPAVMGLGAVAAARRLPAPVTEAGVVEINEAFAAVALACTLELGLDEDRVNPLGGALALGHALGNTGTRLAATLVHHLRRSSAASGVIAMCVGGGQGVAAQLEAVS
jgi:acetyl-CoA acetyltransferase family protein